MTHARILIFSPFVLGTIGALFLLAQGCPATTSHSVILGTEQSLINVGETFLSTAAAFKAANAEGAVTPEEYAAWVSFGTKFKATYGPLVDAWEVANTANDAALAGKLYDSIGVLVDELAKFATDVAAAVAAWNQLHPRGSP